jgi:hypothetical protein
MESCQRVQPGDGCMLLGVGALTKRLNTKSKARRKTKNKEYQE